MKRKHVLGIAAGLTLALGSLSSLHWPFFAKKAPVALEPSDPVEPAPPIVVSAEDQGYVDCPEETEAGMDEDAVQAPPASYCLAEVLPWNKAPDILSESVALVDLEKQCGKVFADFLFYRGDGRCQWGTAMFPGTKREIQITWRNWTERSGPRSLRFVGADLRFENGMRPGLLLKDLAAMNGQAISLAGFGWEGSGRHRSFQLGKFQGFDTTDSPYLIQYALDWGLFDDASEAEHASIIVGEQALESTEPTLEKFRARVEFIEYRYSSQDRSMGEALRSPK